MVTRVPLAVRVSICVDIDRHGSERLGDDTSETQTSVTSARAPAMPFTCGQNAATALSASRYPGILQGGPWLILHIAWTP